MRLNREHVRTRTESVRVLSCLQYVSSSPGLAAALRACCIAAAGGDGRASIVRQQPRPSLIRARPRSLAGIAGERTEPNRGEAKVSRNWNLLLGSACKTLRNNDHLGDDIIMVSQTILVNRTFPG
ncbi:uncharacterized protein LOC113464744 [Ceratina calcarata]|uniref:Uncharacterized protein LOC113464744 n=1 Tax=Ceratina calcarata TaxID=156304 RepID=A0AAJ7WE60_9HYME|nr:uncharacterized protein LOC113464744 [Ceratina calcarata]